MGMFDEILCEAPLPDGYGATGQRFQTKSLPDPCLFRYTITQRGRLLDQWGNDCEPDGYINFYIRDRTDGSDAEDSERGWRE